MVTICSATRARDSALNYCRISGLRMTGQFVRLCTTLMLILGLSVVNAAEPVWFADGSAGCAIVAVPVAQGATQEEACAAAFGAFSGVFNNGCGIPTDNPSRSVCVVNGCNRSGGCWTHTMRSWQACADGSAPVNGVCPERNRCAGKDSEPPTYAWVSYYKEQSPYGYRCKAGCKVAQTGPVSHPTMNPNSEIYVGGTHDRHELMKTQYFAEECSVGDSGTPSPEPTVDPVKAPPPLAKDPKCAANEGVLTTSRGTIACVPQGTVEARVPLVTTQKKTETYPDNSTKVTETTKTVDPATNVSDVKTTVISSGGQAGPAGTTASSEQSSGVGAGSGSGSGSGSGGGNGSCDPKIDFCGGPGTNALYTKKTKTVASVLGDFKTGIANSGIVAAAGSFFSVSVPGGSCPQWAVEVPVVNVTLNLSQYFCTATAIQMMNLVGAVLLFVASFVGFRWAIL